MTKILAFWRVFMTSLQCFILFLCLKFHYKKALIELHKTSQAAAFIMFFHEIKMILWL